MCDQISDIIMPGTLVWVQVVDSLWWPAKVVDPATTPYELHYLTCLNAIAMVYIEGADSKYVIVRDKNNLKLYTCSQKMEFVKRGFKLNFAEVQGIKYGKSIKVNMCHFIKDVLRFEFLSNGHFNDICTSDIKYDDCGLTEMEFGLPIINIDDAPNFILGQSQNSNGSTYTENWNLKTDNLNDINSSDDYTNFEEVVKDLKDILEQRK